MRSRSETVDYYLEEVCQHGNVALQFAYMLTLQRQAAWDCVSAAFDMLSREVPSDDDALPLALASACWKAYAERPEWPSAGTEPLARALGTLTVFERAAYGAIDVLGLSQDLAAQALDQTPTILRKSLSEARQKLLKLEIS